MGDLFNLATSDACTALNQAFTSVFFGPNCCAYPGVTCSGANIVGLSLASTGLTGPLRDSIGSLTTLTTLDVSFNQLTGPLPSSLGNLVNLQTLMLSDNQFTGTLPASLGNLKQLTFLQATGNNISGAIPDSIGNLVSLTSLDLGLNSLTGAIPATLGNLNNLQRLSLARNNLAGDIPSSLSSLSKLTGLFLSLNTGLTGTLSAVSFPTVTNSTNGQCTAWGTGLCGATPDVAAKCSMPTCASNSVSGPSGQSSGSSGMSLGAIAGAVVGVLLVVGIAVALFIFRGKFIKSSTSTLESIAPQEQPNTINFIQDPKQVQSTSVTIPEAAHAAAPLPPAIYLQPSGSVSSQSLFNAAAIPLPPSPRPSSRASQTSLNGIPEIVDMEPRDAVVSAPSEIVIPVRSLADAAPAQVSEPSIASRMFSMFSSIIAGPSAPAEQTHATTAANDADLATDSVDVMQEMMDAPTLARPVAASSDTPAPAVPSKQAPEILTLHSENTADDALDLMQEMMDAPTLGRPVNRVIDTSSSEDAVDLMQEMMDAPTLARPVSSTSTAAAAVVSAADETPDHAVSQETPADEEQLEDDVAAADLMQEMMDAPTLDRPVTVTPLASQQISNLPISEIPELFSKEISVTSLRMSEIWPSSTSVVPSTPQEGTDTAAVDLMQEMMDAPTLARPVSSSSNTAAAATTTLLDAAADSQEVIGEDSTTAESAAN